MATLKQLQEYLNELEQTVREKVPIVIAEEAVKYFKQRFTEKDWDGQPWPDAKNPKADRSKLLLKTSALMNSITPSLITQDVVRISAGGAKIPYAKIHNEGGEVNVKAPITDKMRKFAWAKFYETGNEKFKFLAITEKEELDFTFTMPKRQFMGHSEQLYNIIIETISGIIEAAK